MFGSFGIVSIKDTINNKVKHYIWPAKWDDEADDTLRILEYGAKFYPEHFSEFII